MNEFEKMEVGQIFRDKNMGCEWIARERIPGGVRLQVNKEGGPFMDATPDTCSMEFELQLQFFAVTMEPEMSLCILGARQPSKEEAEAFIRRAYSDLCAGHVIEDVIAISADHARDEYDLSNLSSWPIFGLSTDMYPVEGRRIWSRKRAASGIVKGVSQRYCAACQRIHDCYVVKWTNGMTTKPCTAGIKLLDNGEMQII